MDRWGAGSYEETAAELAPVSDVAVAALGLAGGERVLDVACGTGNAAAVAAGAGARVTGLDASPRLLQVARERVRGAEFVEGDAARLPFADGEFDAAVSVFGVIFATPAERAAAEMARVVRPGGRLAITSWLPGGPISAAGRLLRGAVDRVRPPDGPPPADWGERSTLVRLLAPYGELDLDEHELGYHGVSSEQLWDRWEQRHPMWIAARGLLEPAGQWEAVREASIAALHDGGLDAGAGSPYLLAVLEVA